LLLHCPTTPHPCGYPAGEGIGAARQIDFGSCPVIRVSASKLTII